MTTLDAAMATPNGVTSALQAYRLRQVTQYIQENLPRDIRLAELGALVHMSPYHFARLFKRSTGVPPHRFQVLRRITGMTPSAYRSGGQGTARMTETGE